MKSESWFLDLCCVNWTKNKTKARRCEEEGERRKEEVKEKEGGLRVFIIGLAAGDGVALLLGGRCVCVCMSGGQLWRSQKRRGSIKYQRLD